MESFFCLAFKFLTDEDFDITNCYSCRSSAVDSIVDTYSFSSSSSAQF